MILKLLEYNADLHSGDNRALRWSAKGGHLNIVSKLLELGANVNAGGYFIHSALEMAARFNHPSIVTKLLEHNANVHARNDYALRLAAQYHNFETMAILLEYGANVHCDDKQILKDLKNDFNEEMANLLLPYCGTDDYKYFPKNVIRERIISTKSANTYTCAHNGGTTQ